VYYLTKLKKSVGLYSYIVVQSVLKFQLDNYEIRKGKNVKVNISVANQRLFVGSIPKSKSKDEIYEEFSKKTGMFLNRYVQSG